VFGDAVGMKYFAENVSFFFSGPSPVFRLFLLWRFLRLPFRRFPFALPEIMPNQPQPVKRNAAEAQFTRAEEQRAALNNKPAESARSRNTNLSSQVTKGFI